MLKKRFNKDVHKDHVFLDMAFKDADEVRIAVDEYAIQNGRCLSISVKVQF